jgi:hypothetical protein
MAGAVASFSVLGRARSWLRNNLTQIPKLGEPEVLSFG